MTDCCPFGSADSHSHENPSRNEIDQLNVLMAELAELVDRWVGATSAALASARQESFSA